MVSRWDWAKPVRLPLGTLWSNQSKNFIHYLCVSWITRCINVKSESTKWHWLEAMSCSESHVWGGDWCARLCRECSWDHELWERKEGRQQGGRRRQPWCRPTPWGALKLAQAFLLLHKNKSLDVGPWEEDVVMLRCHFSSEAILIWADSWGSCRDSPAVLTGPLRGTPLCGSSPWKCTEPVLASLCHHDSCCCYQHYHSLARSCTNAARGSIPDRSSKWRLSLSPWGVTYPGSSGAQGMVARRKEDFLFTALEGELPDQKSFKLICLNFHSGFP